MVSAIGALLFIPVISSAQQAGQGLEIAPPLIELKADPGQILTTQIRLTNVTTQTLVARAQYNDFVADGESGKPKLLLDNSEQSPYSIKDWLSSIPSVTLVSREQKTLDVSINVPKNASPGGHYGVIRFTGAPPNVDQSAVSLSASIGSLVLVTVSGNVQEQAHIAQIFTSQNNKQRSIFEYGPVAITTRIENTGNVHIQPSGTIRVTNMFGKTVGTFQFNQTLGNVLPKSTRRFDNLLQNKFMFGRYKIQADIVYGTKKTIVSGSATFWVIPYKLILLGLAAIILLVFLIRRYNRYILNKAQKRRENATNNKNQKPKKS